MEHVNKHQTTQDT